MLFLNASVLERKALNRNLSWGFPLGNFLPKTRVLKHRVLERKRRPNANASVLGTQRFRTLSLQGCFWTLTLSLMARNITVATRANLVKRNNIQICQRPHLVGTFLGFKMSKSRGREEKLRQKRQKEERRKKLGNMKPPPPKKKNCGFFFWPFFTIKLGKMIFFQKWPRKNGLENVPRMHFLLSLNFLLFPRKG